MNQSTHLKYAAPILAVLSLSSGAALAQEVSTINAYFNLTSDGVATIDTAPMPHGWFSSKNTLDRNKTDLRGSLNFSSTVCSEAKPSFVFTSTTQGQFSPVLNSQGHTRAWTWSYLGDVQSGQNRWYRHQHCDGSIEVHGCDAPISVSMSVTAFDPKTNACRTIDSTGACATRQLSAVLASVQDPDVIDTDCGGAVAAECGIGPCVSSCEQTCNLIQDKNEKQRCKQQCVCECKLALPASCAKDSRCE